MCGTAAIPADPRSSAQKDHEDGGWGIPLSIRRIQAVTETDHRTSVAGRSRRRLAADLDSPGSTRWPVGLRTNVAATPVATGGTSKPPPSLEVSGIVLEQGADVRPALESPSASKLPAGIVRWMPAAHLYDVLGRTYSATRREDPQVAAHIWTALGVGRSLLNVGAGTGSYEPTDRMVVALEPSQEMIGQRVQRTHRVVRGIAEQLPFADATFDASLAVFTVHHWTDREAGLSELRRVSKRQVVVFFEPLVVHQFWAVDYFEETKELPSEQNAPSERLLRALLPVREVQTVLVPRDCVDGFGAAFWARPEAYLDPAVQAGTSWMALLPAAVLERGTDRLRGDLASGAWDARHGHLRSMDTYDAGYRLAIAEDQTQG